MLFVKLLWCSGLPWIYGQLEERGGVNLLWVYVHCTIYEPMWCNSFLDIYAWLQEGWGQSAMGICALYYIYIKLIWCNGFPDIYAQLEGVHLPSVYMCILLYVNLIWSNGLVWGLWLIGGQVHLPSVYMWILLWVKLIWHNGLPFSFGWLQGVSICLCYICAFSYMWKFFRCNGVA